MCIGRAVVDELEELGTISQTRGSEEVGTRCVDEEPRQLVFNAVVSSVGIRLTVPRNMRHIPIVYFQCRAISLRFDRSLLEGSYSAEVGSLSIQDIRPYQERGIFSQVVRGMWRKQGARQSPDAPLFTFTLKLNSEERRATVDVVLAGLRVLAVPEFIVALAEFQRAASRVPKVEEVVKASPVRLDSMSTASYSACGDLNAEMEAEQVAAPSMKWIFSASIKDTWLWLIEGGDDKVAVSKLRKYRRALLWDLASRFLQSAWRIARRRQPTVDVASMEQSASLPARFAESR